MKASAICLTIPLTFSLALNLFAQQQRLAVLPQSIAITNTASAKLKTICIDYYREVLVYSNTKDQPKFDQIYSKGDVPVIINGVPSTKNFQLLVQEDNPLLLFTPVSSGEVDISINPDNPEAKKIRKIEIDFKSPIEIGNIADDMDVLQAQIIFKTWGNNISQENFFDRAKCLDILKQNNKVTYPQSGQITEDSKQLCDRLIGKLDFTVFSGKTFKSFVDNGFFVLDENLNLTDESNQILKQSFYYIQSISTTKEIGKYWMEYGKMISNKRDSFEKKYADGAKNFFYSANRNLTLIGKENHEIQDTLIDGLRYVLMVAWKSINFTDYITRSGNSMPTYKSNVQLFTYPLFMTPEADMERWAIQANENSLDETHSRTRLMELLGLPPNSTNNTFIEFWAKENDVFRPAIDSSLKSSQMMLKLSAEYIATFTGFVKGSFENENILKEYPFTGLGYTYDYNPENLSHIGVTEFVLKENRMVYIRQIKPTHAYLNSITTGRAVNNK